MKTPKRRTGLFVANMKNANTTLIGLTIIGVLVLHRFLGSEETWKFIEIVIFVLTAMGLINSKDAIMEDYPDENTEKGVTENKKPIN
jgi:hypothetical protein